MRFLALKPSSPRGRSAMQAFDANVAFISFVRLGWRSYPDSEEVASSALAASKHVPRSRLMYRLKLLMFRCQYNWARQYFENHTDTAALCWNGLSGSRRAFVEGARRAGAATVLFELAPLPGRISIDGKGVNYFNSLPREASFYLNWQQAHPELEGGWREVRDSIVSRQASKNANVQQIQRSVPLEQRPYLFVPLQVQNDSQIRLFGGLVGSVTHFVELLNQHAKALPEGWTLRIKEHPTSKIPYGLDRIITNNEKVVVDNVTDTIQLIKDSEAVITINSSVGLEAMFFEKPVLVLGQAFYGFDRIANTIQSPDELEDIFGNPLQRLKFEDRPVAAFLNYLSNVYYPRVALVEKGICSIAPDWLEDFKSRMAVE